MADPKWTLLIPVADKIVPLLASAIDGAALLDSLLSRRCLSQDQYEELLRHLRDRSREDVARELLSILRRTLPPSFDSFCAVLQEGNDGNRKAVYDLLVTSAQAHESSRKPCENLPVPEDKTRIALDTIKEDFSDPPSKKEALEPASTTTGVAQADESSTPCENSPSRADDRTQITRARKRSFSTVNEDYVDPPSKAARADFPEIVTIHVHEKIRGKWIPNSESFTRIVKKYSEAAALPGRKISIDVEFL